MTIAYIFKPPDVDLATAVIPDWCASIPDDALATVIEGIERDIDEGTAHARASALLIALYAEHFRREQVKPRLAMLTGTFRLDLSIQSNIAFNHYEIERAIYEFARAKLQSIADSSRPSSIELPTQSHFECPFEIKGAPPAERPWGITCGAVGGHIGSTYPDLINPTYPTRTK